ncbi:MAG TPA: permease, partial [Gemmataceae bacterium]|nr:permease [Gemmataceae bacterium]
VAKVMPRSRLLGIAIGGLLGLLFPMCECGIIPVMRRLLRKGVPLSSCVAYLLAGPIINVVVMLSTYVAFLGMDADAAGQASHQFGGTLMVGLRMGFGYLVALGTALIVEWQYRKHGTALLAPAAVADTKAADLASAQQQVQETTAGGTAIAAPPVQAMRPSVMQRLGNISQVALHDFIDITVYLVLGAILAAVIRLAFTHQQMESWSQQNAPLAILTMMGLAIIMCLCSEADAFVAASFKPFIPAAKLGFLVLGPMLDFKLYMMYTRVFRPRLIWTIIISVAVQVFIYSLLVHYAWNTYIQYKFGTP